MSSELIGLLSLVVLLILIYSGMRVGLALALVGFCGLVCIGGFNTALSVLKYMPFRQLNSESFAAMVMFMIVGEIIFQAGFGVDMFTSLKHWFGRIRGGLAMATTGASAVLGFITSSAVANVTMGKLAVPQMQEAGYDNQTAAGAVAGGAAMASIVPPSSGFIVFAMLTGESLSKLYTASIIPAALLFLLFMTFIAIHCRLHPQKGKEGEKYSLKEKIYSLRQIWPIALVIIVSLVGIYRGFMTPTEAACITLFVCMLLSILTRRLSFATLQKIVVGQAQTVGMIALLMSSASIFGRLITLSNISNFAANWIVSMHISPIVILALITIIYILLGMFSDIAACMMITLPIFYPLVTSLGVNGIWFGILTVSLTELGMISPPLGMNVFTLSGITGIDTVTIFKGVLPYLFAILILIVLLFVWPGMTLVFL